MLQDSGKPGKNHENYGNYEVSYNKMVGKVILITLSTCMFLITVIAFVYNIKQVRNLLL